MGNLTLVRHGQASFGAANYDQLSELGARQCVELGRYFAERGRRFDAVLTGTLQRHAQSLEALASALPGLPATRAVAAWNEYDAEGLVRAAAGERLSAPPDSTIGATAGSTLESPSSSTIRSTDGDRREHFRVLRTALERWMRGDLSVPGMPSWEQFRAGVVEVLDELRRGGAGDVLVVSSGGPISTAIAHALQAPPAAVVALNLQMRNSAVSELTATSSRHWLVGYNALPHLDHPERAGWVTLA